MAAVPTLSGSGIIAAFCPNQLANKLLLDIWALQKLRDLGGGGGGTGVISEFYVNSNSNLKIKFKF